MVLSFEVSLFFCVFCVRGVHASAIACAAAMYFLSLHSVSASLSAFVVVVVVLAEAF
jgi:hypothetical protein